MSDRCHIGTSGFYYEHWRGLFYPEELPKSRFFDYYVHHFSTVEMNSTFYHLPKAKTIEHWLENSPEYFLFSLKAYRGITHYKKLVDVKSDLYAFFHLIKPLKPKIGAILFQLPPSLHLDIPKLADFLHLLPPSYRYAIEFRHDSWYCEEIYELLRHYNVALCIHDFGQKRSPFVQTAHHLYIRFHGTNGRYAGSYDDETLKEWVSRLKPLCKSGHDIFCYFNNDYEGAAVQDALRLRSFLETE